MVVAIIIIAVLLLLYLFMVSPALRKHPDRQLCKGLLVAHRGLHNIKKGIPENSIAAYKNAIENGYAIEIDIHLTKDGRLAVFHDDTLLRVCGDDKVVEELTLDELKSYNLSGTSEKIPSLEEVLHAVDGKVPLVIEVKSTSANCSTLCKSANEVLKNYKGKYIIQSFNPMVLRWYKLNRRDICRGQLSTHFLKEPDNSVIKTLVGLLLTNVLARPDFISYEIKYTGVFWRGLCSLLGAFNAGWTFRNYNEYKKYKDKYDIVIFEDFLPNKKERLS